MKKSLSAIFCLVIMLSLSVPVSASAFDSSNYASSNSSAVAQSQYEMLMDSFGFDSSLSDIVYPSNYGGAYINSEGALVVMQTNSIPRDTSTTVFWSSWGVKHGSTEVTQGIYCTTKLKLCVELDTENWL